MSVHSALTRSGSLNIPAIFVPPMVRSLWNPDFGKTEKGSEMLGGGVLYATQSIYHKKSFTVVSIYYIAPIDLNIFPGKVQGPI